MLLADAATNSLSPIFLVVVIVAALAIRAYCKRVASVMIHEFVKETPTIFENMASAVAVQTNGLAAVL